MIIKLATDPLKVVSQSQLQGSAKERRQRQWDNRERTPRCKNHPEKLVKPSSWINRGLLLCTWCFNNQPSQRRAQIKYRTSDAGKEQHRWRKRSWRRYLKIEENKIGFTPSRWQDSAAGRS